METQRPWHHLFGLSLIDLLRDQPMTVELEKDLSLKQQFLDVVILRKGSEPLTRRLPDGFEDLAAHNLITFKSYQETFDGWALDELIGHYTNYRKQASPTMRDLLPEGDFRLFAVTVRFPQTLARSTDLRLVQPGVYQLPHRTGGIRVIVVHELPQEEHNAIFHLFSAIPDLLRYGNIHYRTRSQETSTLLLQLLEQYRQENPLMADALETFAKEYIDELLRRLPAEERLKGLPTEEILKRFPAEERVKGVPAEERLKGLSMDALMEALSLENRAKLAQKLKDQGLPSDQ